MVASGIVQLIALELMSAFHDYPKSRSLVSSTLSDQRHPCLDPSLARFNFRLGWKKYCGDGGAV